VNAERGEHPRPLWGLPQLVGHLALAFALVPAWRLARTPGRRATLERRFFRRALRAVGVEVRVTGRPVPGPGVLFVANHLSFTDIVALAPLLHATFVAKADVRRWPVMGRLVARFGTIFVERKRPMDADRASGAGRSAAARGRPRGAFPGGHDVGGRAGAAFPLDAAGRGGRMRAPSSRSRCATQTALAGPISAMSRWPRTSSGWPRTARC
jgi:1-acyl-sn-glycerol-3-phosphate acyltransferase